MINKEININECDVRFDEVFTEQGSDTKKEILNTESNTDVAASDDEHSKNTIKKIIQRCHGMFIKNETLQEKKRRLTNFVNQT